MYYAGSIRSFHFEWICLEALGQISQQQFEILLLSMPNIIWSTPFSISVRRMLDMVRIYLSVIPIEKDVLIWFLCIVF